MKSVYGGEFRSRDCMLGAKLNKGTEPINSILIPTSVSFTPSYHPFRDNCAVRDEVSIPHTWGHRSLTPSRQWTISQVSLIHPLKSHRIDHFSDVVIRCPSDKDDLNILPDDACIFCEVVVDGNIVKRTEQFLKALTGPSWRLDETIYCSRSLTTSS